jgi:hypothetical protein
MTDVNRANWNVWAAAHGQDAYYDRAGLLAGEDSLTYLEWPASAPRSATCRTATSCTCSATSASTRSPWPGTAPG